MLLKAEGTCNDALLVPFSMSTSAKRSHKTDLSVDDT